MNGKRTPLATLAATAWPNANRWYPAYDPRRYGVLYQLLRRQSLTKDDIARARQIFSTIRRSGRHLATLPRSGTGLVTTMLTTAIDIETGGTGQFQYTEGVLLSEDGAWIHDDLRLRYSAGGPKKFAHEVVTWRSMPLRPELFFVSHYPLSSVIVRPTGPRVRAIVVVRNILDQLASWARHGDHDELQFLSSGRLDQAIEFCNHWGQHFAKPPKGWTGLLVRYEDLIHNPSGELRRMCTFWDLEISPATTHRAVTMTSREAMEALVTSVPANKRITTVARRSEFSAATVDSLRSMLSSKLDYSFGYDYGY